MNRVQRESAMGVSEQSTATDTAKLLDWLSDHDEPCPLCGYNLRALTDSRCPECEQELVLTVGAREIRLAWLLLAIAPGFFSGIAAIFFLVPVVGATLAPNARPEWPVIMVDAFGFASGIFAIVLARRRVWFLSKRVRVQQAIALSVWGVHVLMFLLLLALVLYF